MLWFATLTELRFASSEDSKDGYICCVLHVLRIPKTDIKSNRVAIDWQWPRVQDVIHQVSQGNEALALVVVGTTLPPCL